MAIYFSGSGFIANGQPDSRRRYRCPAGLRMPI